MHLEAAPMILPAPWPLRLRDAALFLDLDGTLAPIAARPDAVGPDTRRTRLLQRLDRALGGRLAVISGRTLADVDRILEGRVAHVSAVHGLVRRQDGEVITAPPTAASGVARAVAVLRAYAARDPALILEEKGPSVALHYRQARARGPEVRLLAGRLAAETGLVVQSGHMVEELRTPGPSKGDAVEAFMARRPFAGFRPVFAGDDATDEAGFRTAVRLGGFGVLVGAERDTAATFGLRNVGDVLAWLESSL